MKSILIIISICWSSLATAQAIIDPLWQFQIGPSGGESPQSFIPAIMKDSSHHIICFGGDYMPGPSIGFLTFKLNQEGQLLWKQVYQSPALDFLTAGAVASDGSVYTGGSTIQAPFGVPGNKIIIKYTADGQIEWQKTVQIPHGNCINLVQFMIDSDQSLLVFGNYNDSLAQRAGMFIQKNDPTGVVQWTKSYIHPDTYFAMKLAGRINDRFVLWGRDFSVSGSDVRFICVQSDTMGNTLEAHVSIPYPSSYSTLYLDPSGNLYTDQSQVFRTLKLNLNAEQAWMFYRSYGAQPEGKLLDVKTDMEGNTYLTGHIRIDSTHIDNCTIKLDGQGNTIWEHCVTSAFDLVTDRIFWLSDKYLLAAGSQGVNLDSNVWKAALVLYDKNGFLKSFSSDYFHKSIDRILIDGEYIYAIGGGSDGPPSYTSHYFVWKLSIQEIIGSESSTKNNEIQPLAFGPNPFHEQVTLLTPSSQAEWNLRVLNTQGRVVFEQKSAIKALNLTIQTVSWSAGVYFFEWIVDGKRYVTKGVKAPGIK